MLFFLSFSIDILFGFWLCITIPCLLFMLVAFFLSSEIFALLAGWMGGWDECFKAREGFKYMMFMRVCLFVGCWFDAWL